MITEFVESLTKGLLEKWLERLFGPALLFWGGGLLLVIGLENLSETWKELSAKPMPEQVGLLVAALFVLSLSSALMSILRLPLLRLLEGYWPWPLNMVGRGLIRLRQKSARKRRLRHSELLQKHQNGTLTPHESEELARLETWRQFTPRDLEDFLPTALGNILRAAETRPRQRYGLDPILLWPRLWLLLPEETQNTLSATHERLAYLVEAWAWGFAFLVWTPWWWGAVIIALAWMLITYWLALAPAQTFAMLVQSVFDLHRWKLYKSLHWPLPERSGEAETTAGEALTRYIQRGMVEKPVLYQHPEE